MENEINKSACKSKLLKHMFMAGLTMDIKSRFIVRVIHYIRCALKYKAVQGKHNNCFWSLQDLILVYLIGVRNVQRIRRSATDFNYLAKPCLFKLLLGQFLPTYFIITLQVQYMTLQLYMSSYGKDIVKNAYNKT